MREIVAICPILCVSACVGVFAETKEEEEREQKVMEILEMFKLQGGPYQTELIMAKSGDRLLGAMPVGFSVVAAYFSLAYAPVVRKC